MSEQIESVSAEVDKLNHVTIKIGNKDILAIKEIFKNEADFAPQRYEDKLIIAILRQVMDNPKTVIE